MIHLLVGPDRFLVESELQRLLADYDPDNLYTTRFDKASDLSQIASAAATIGFFGSGRVIVAEGILARASGTAKGKKSDAETISTLLSGVAPYNHLILLDVELASVPKAIKDGAPVSAEIFAGSVPRGSELVRWTQAETKRLGGAIEPRAAQDLLGILYPGRWAKADQPQYDRPPDLATLTRRLEALVLYADDRPITSADVAATVAAESSDQMFALTDSLFAGDTGKSLQLLIDQGLDDDSAARLMGYAGTQAELALAVASAERHESLESLGKELGGVSAGRLARLQKGVNPSSAATIGKDVASADRRLKTGKVRGVQSQLFDLLISRARKERGR